MNKILINSPVTGKRETLTQDQFNSYMAQTNGAVLDWIVNPMQKHQAGNHDQTSHGSWALDRFDRPDGYDGLNVPAGELPDTVYHVTSSKNDQAISAGGLHAHAENTWNTGAGSYNKYEDNWIWGKGEDGEWEKEEYRPVGVYVFGSLNSAKNYAQSGNSIYAIDTKTTLADGADVIRDPSWSENWDYMDDPESEQAWVFNNVPVGAISLVMQKHLAGQHDQITHGSWAGRGLAPNIVEDMKSYYGTTFEEFKNSEAFKRISEKTVQAHVTNTNVGDVNLEFVAEKQGFDGKPKVVTSEQMDALEKDGWTIAYRGIVDGETISGDPISADAIVDEFINGKYYGGRGTSGNGTYFAESKEVAEYYAQGGSATPVPMFGQSSAQSGRVIKVAIPKGTMMSAFDFQDAIVEHRENVKNKKLWWNGDDIGVALAAQGYRGTEQVRGLPMNSSEAYKVYVIWDRSMLAVEEIR